MSVGNNIWTANHQTRMHCPTLLQKTALRVAETGRQRATETGT